MPDKDILDRQIIREKNEIRTDKFDISYGELASMYVKGELIISPEYQRYFRWSDSQKAKFIESILLGFPIPAIFVAESDEGIWELVDGLQRVSTVLEFMGELRNSAGEKVPPSRINLSDTRSRLPELHGFSFEDLSQRSSLAIKRANCRVEVIKVGSAPRMKYEVFERLNTGASGLSDQEVRNCIFRASSPDFMEWVDRMAQFPAFVNSLGLSDSQWSSMYDRGLILRFLTLKNNQDGFRHEVEPFVTEYIRGVVEGDTAFPVEKEQRIFEETFSRLWDALGEDAWRHCKDGQHRGAFSVYVFDALSVAVSRNLEMVQTLPPDVLRSRCIAAKESTEFSRSIGAGGNTRPKMLARLNAAIQFIRGGV